MAICRRTTGACLAAAALLVSGCGGGDEGGGGEPAATSQDKPLVTNAVGRVDGSDAFIAINAYRNGDVVGYVCDGKRLGEVLNGSVTDGELALVSDGGAKVTGTMTKESAEGTFTGPDGKALEFTAERPTGDGGAYRAVDKVDGKEVKAGWVVLSNGEQRGLVRVAGSPSPAPKLNTTTLSVQVDGVGTLKPQATDPVTQSSGGMW